MIFKEFGNKNNKAIILIHGGGLSWWTWKTQIEVLKNDYFVVAPILLLQLRKEYYYHDKCHK